MFAWDVGVFHLLLFLLSFAKPHHPILGTIGGNSIILLLVYTKLYLPVLDKYCNDIRACMWKIWNRYKNTSRISHIILLSIFSLLTSLNGILFHSQRMTNNAYTLPAAFSFLYFVRKTCADPDTFHSAYTT